MLRTECGIALEVTTERHGGQWVVTVAKLDMVLYGATAAEADAQVEPALVAFAQDFVIATNDVQFEKLHKFLEDRNVPHDLSIFKERFKHWIASQSG